MAAQPSSTSGRRPARLSRDSIVNAALTFLDREGWDALTINALATQLGTKGPSLYNHVQQPRGPAPHRADAGGRRHHRDAQDGRAGPHPRRRGDGDGQPPTAAMPTTIPGRYSAFTRMPLGGDDPEFTEATRADGGAGDRRPGVLWTGRRERVLRGAGVLVGDARLRVARDDRRDERRSTPTRCSPTW